MGLSASSKQAVNGGSGRPRIRLQSPVITFKASATLRPSKERDSDKPKDPYLPRGMPFSMNLLESLKGAPGFEGAEPRLSASRLSHINPVAQDGNPVDSILRTGPQHAFRALPAISSRVRYSKPNNRVGKASIIASLDIEAAPLSNDDMEIVSVDMQLSEGFTEDLGKLYLPALPLTCRPKDSPVFLFRLTPNESFPDGSILSSARSVLITVHANVLVSKTCRPTIEMRWKTGVDFSTALNPVYGAPGQSIQRPRRPSSLSRAPSATNNNKLPPYSQEGETAPNSGGNQTRQPASSASDFGVSLTFTAPKTVHVGQPFSWTILLLNGSLKPRHLALTVIPKRKKGFPGGHLSKHSTSSASGRKESDIADSVIDENLLYAMQRNSGNDGVEVISLSTDVRVG